METFVEKRRGAASTNQTRIVKETIEYYLPDFLDNYQYQKETIPGLQFLYEGSRLRTNYSNNIQTRLSTHLCKTINSLLHVNDLRQQPDRLGNRADSARGPPGSKPEL